MENSGFSLETLPILFNFSPNKCMLYYTLIKLKQELFRCEWRPMSGPTFDKSW